MQLLKATDLIVLEFVHSISIFFCVVYFGFDSFWEESETSPDLTLLSILDKTKLSKPKVHL